MRAIKHERIYRAKGLYRYIPNICLYLYVFTCVFTSKRLIEKTYPFVDSFEARHTEPLCGWYMAFGESTISLASLHIREDKEKLHASFRRRLRRICRGGLLVNYKLFNKLYIVCKALLDAATFLQM